MLIVQDFQYRLNIFHHYTHEKKMNFYSDDSKLLSILRVANLLCDPFLALHPNSVMTQTVMIQNFDYLVWVF